MQSAAEDYFQTNAKDLWLPEAAMLAAMPQAPSYYSPYGSTQYNPDAGNTFDQGALIGRQQYILNLMATVALYYPGASECSYESQRFGPGTSPRKQVSKYPGSVFFFGC